MDDEEVSLENVKPKGSLYKRAKRKVKKVAGGGNGKLEPRQRRPSTNPVSLAASEALHATKKTLRLSVRFTWIPCFTIAIITIRLLGQV
jgi:hypothetical protein